MKNVWLLVLACICMTACRNRQQSAEVTNYDLPQIKDSRELVVLTLNSSTSYFDYRGEPMGFQYELADQFARSLDVKLKIKVDTQGIEEMLKYIKTVSEKSEEYIQILYSGQEKKLTIKLDSDVDEMIIREDVVEMCMDVDKPRNLAKSVTVE